MLDRSSILAASERIRTYIRPTPVMTLEAGELLRSKGVTLKLEFLQHTGSFKPRGAFNRLLCADVPNAGVVAASGGNHGAAVAFAARALRHRASIFVPSLTSATKVGRILTYGAEVVQVGAHYADALQACLERQRTTGAMGVHAYDDAAVLEGQGTVGLELERDAPAVTHVLVAVGGGGLIGGIGAWYAGTEVQVIGVEPEGCPSFSQALKAGRPVPVEVGGIAADSLGAQQSGALMFEVAQRTGMTCVLVTDAAIRSAQGWLWDRLRIVAEPGGATALAALLSSAWVPPKGSRVAVVLCGANTDPAAVSRETLVD